MIYYWDGSRWTIFNSIELHYGRDSVNTNADEADIRGSGAALSYDLMPFTPQLLCLDDHFCGFRGSDGGELAINGVRQTKCATATIGHLGTKKVCRLTLTRDVNVYHDIENYWIDPQTFTIIKQRSYSAQKAENHTDITTRQTLHRPKVSTLPQDAVIKFSPPQARSNKPRGCVKSPDPKFGNDQIFGVRHFDETSRWMEWSKNEFSHSLPLQATAAAPASCD